MATYEIIMSASVQASKLHSMSNIGYCLKKKSDILSKQSLFPWEVANDRCDKSGGGQNLKKRLTAHLCLKIANQIIRMTFKEESKWKEK